MNGFIVASVEHVIASRTRFVLLSKSSKKVWADFIRLFVIIMCRCIYLLNASTVLVVSHQNSVLVTLRISGVIVLPYFVRQVLSMRRVEVPKGEIFVLPFVLNYWKQRMSPKILEFMKSIFSFHGITQSPHVVVQAFLDVPDQQPEAVAGRGLSKAAVLQFLL